MKIAFAGFGEVNTPIEIIERKCKKALEDLQASGAEVYSCYPITDDYEEKEIGGTQILVGNGGKLSVQHVYTKLSTAR